MKKIIIALISIFVCGLTQCITFAQSFETCSDINFIAYVNRLENTVKSNWVIPHGKLDKKTVILLDIDKKGKLLGANVVNFSGDKKFDKTAMEAIIQSTPFEAFPQTIQDEKATIKFTFDQTEFEAAAVSNITISNNNSDNNIQPVADKKSAGISSDNINLTISNDNSTGTINFGPYLNDLQTNIKSNWHPNYTKYSQNAILGFEIDKSGNLKEIKIIQSSGNKKFDKIAINAIYQTAPFSPLPAEFQQNAIDIRFTFNYNVVQQCNDKPPLLIPYHYQVRPYYYYYHKPEYCYQSARANFYNHYKPSYPPYITYYYPPRVVNNYYTQMPSDFSSPVTKFWAADRLIWLSFLVAHVCKHGI